MAEDLLSSRIHQIQMIQIPGEFEVIAGGITAESRFFTGTYDGNCPWFQ